MIYHVLRRAQHNSAGPWLPPLVYRLKIKGDRRAQLGHLSHLAWPVVLLGPWEREDYPSLPLLPHDESVLSSSRP